MNKGSTVQVLIATVLVFWGGGSLATTVIYDSVGPDRQYVVAGDTLSIDTRSFTPRPYLDQSISIDAPNASPDNVSSTFDVDETQSTGTGAVADLTFKKLGETSVSVSGVATSVYSSECLVELFGTCGLLRETEEQLAGPETYSGGLDLLVVPEFLNDTKSVFAIDPGTKLLFQATLSDFLVNPPANAELLNAVTRVNGEVTDQPIRFDSPGFFRVDLLGSQLFSYQFERRTQCAVFDICTPFEPRTELVRVDLEEPASTNTVYGVFVRDTVTVVPLPSSAFALLLGLVAISALRLKSRM
ncbi:MAG: hypothetical protein AAF340_16385 [Pseudomonadota bacterium]